MAIDMSMDTVWFCSLIPRPCSFPMLGWEHGWFDYVESQFLDCQPGYQPHTLWCNQIICPIFWVMYCLAAVDEDSVAIMLASSINLVIQQGPLYRDIKASQKSFAGGAIFNLLVELQPTTDKAAGMVGPAVTWSTLLVVWKIKNNKAHKIWAKIGAAWSV